MPCAALVVSSLLPSLLGPRCARLGLELLPCCLPCPFSQLRAGCGSQGFVLSTPGAFFHCTHDACPTSHPSVNSVFGCLWIRGLISLGRLRLGALRPAVSLLAPLSLVFGLGPWFCFLRRAHCQLLPSLSDDGSCGLFFYNGFDMLFRGRHRSPPTTAFGAPSLQMTRLFLPLTGVCSARCPRFLTRH